MSGWLSAIFGYWSDGGWLLIPLAAVSFAIWAYWLRLRALLQSSVTAARRLERQMDAWLSGAAGAPDWRGNMQESTSPFSRLVGDVFDQAHNGQEARKRFHAMSDWHGDLVKRDLFILKALTAAAPLLGLLGTVTGMVDTFTAVARHGAEGAVLVASGISTALITTQFGLVAALPGVFGILHLGRLRTRLQSAFNAIGMMLYVAYDKEDVPSC